MAKRPDPDIRPSIPRKTRPNRPAPRRRGRTRRVRSILGGTLESRPSARAAPAWARRPGSAAADARLPAPQDADAEEEKRDGWLQPPPDNSFDRRRDFSNAHKARKSTQHGFDERPQSGYVAKAQTDIDAEFADALGYDDSDPSRPLIGQLGPVGAEPQDRDELADIFERQREKRHRPSPQPVTLGVTASMQALEKLLREGRAGIPRGRRHQDLDAAPAAAAGKIRRRAPARDQVRLRSEGRPAAGDQGTGRRRAPQRPHAGAARRHRLGQDLHHGQGDRSRRSGRR